VPFSENRHTDRFVAVCLAATFRSQGFSPSQRLNPCTSSRLCFAPHPLIGLRPSELFPPRPAVVPHDTQCSPAVESAHSPPASGCGNTALSLTTRAHSPTSELCSGLASDTSHTRGLVREAAALLALSPFEVWRSDGWSEDLPSCTKLKKRCGYPQPSFLPYATGYLTNRTSILPPRR
jgi:hypothetical protein